MNTLEFFRNANKQAKYHHPGKNWVRDGKALCGTDISKAGFTVNTRYENGFPDKHPLCKHCAKLLAQ